MDFEGDPGGATDAIDAWASDETNARVPQVIPPGVIDANTRLVLANAVYFEADWASPFVATGTRARPFTRDGSDVSVPMMSQELEVGYGNAGGAEMVELPYVGDRIVMDVVLPAPGALGSFESTFTPDAYDALRASLQRSDVALTLPKVIMRSQESLVSTLKGLGMNAAFSDGADLTGITTAARLFVKDVLQEAYLRVDEQGTEAAASSAVVVSTKDGGVSPAPAVTFVADHPFLFFLRDLPTGTILFEGHVVDPSVTPS